MTQKLVFGGLALAAAVLSSPAHAAPALDGASMGSVWALPFIGTLLSIAAGPVLFPKFWHRHYGKIAAGWALLTIVSLALAYGAPVTLAAVIHAILGEYLSFILLLLALYTVAGGILVTGNLRGSPLTNTGLLALGTLMASIVGTTGAAMILIRPLIRANAARMRNAHVVIFFIILVGNVGGALTPLGDPPLFAGFLRGVDFFWPAENLWRQTAIVAALLLTVFLAVDYAYYQVEAPPRAPAAEPVGLRGAINLAFILLIIASILISAKWKPGVSFDVYGTKMELQNLVRDASLVAIAGLSLWATPETHRAANDFCWEPILEVAKLFAGIFVAIVPVLAMLHAGRTGAIFLAVCVGQRA